MVVNPPEGQLFLPGCFDGQVGKTIPMSLEGFGSRTCIVTAVIVEPGGERAILTVEFEGELFEGSEEQ